MGAIMIPISKDQKLQKTIDGVTYFFHPPVGEMEMKLFSAFPEDNYNLSPNYAKAAAELEKEYNGKRHPQKAKWEELIKDRIMTYINSSEIIQKQIDNMDNILNMSLCDWKSDKKECPVFPKDKPYLMLPMELKRVLFEWYWDQFNLGSKELKK